MNKNNLNETKDSNKQSGDNNDVSGASNAKVTHMYNMPNMTSGPSDVASEKKRKLDELLESSKGNAKK